MPIWQVGSPMSSTILHYTKSFVRLSLKLAMSEKAELRITIPESGGSDSRDHGVVLHNYSDSTKLILAPKCNIWHPRHHIPGEITSLYREKAR